MSAKEIEQNLDKHIDDILLQAFDIVEGVMNYGEGYAKSNAPWNDITAQARNSIVGGAYKEKNGVSEDIVGYLSIGVFYGVYLELANAGRYRIIEPTLFMIRDRLMNVLSKIRL